MSVRTGVVAPILLGLWAWVQGVVLPWMIRPTWGCDRLLSSVRTLQVGCTAPVAGSQEPGPCDGDGRRRQALKTETSDSGGKMVEHL